ncbi:MAG: ATP-binding protein [Candidatus Cloacimonetes bacterium]|nr:ATP-binding protein [Candidatus Cloacimonadota bacterium]
MIRREIEPLLREMMNVFPVVTVTGPRQSGKTTLVRYVFPEMDYVSLEELDKRNYAQSDPRGFLSEYPGSVIIDEIQKVPDLLSYIQTIVDNEKRNGRYILTGSNQFEYMNSISQSLAGRTGILKLLPFSYNELYGNKQVSQNDLLYAGFYPRIFDQKMRPELFYGSYLETYIERDVKNVTKVHDLLQFHRFMQLCAGRIGQIVNYQSFSNELGVDAKTIKNWLSVAMAGYIIYLLPPYFRNFNKRIIKSPKLYFFDVGLVAHLLGIRDEDHLNNHPLRGQLFENFVVMEFLKSNYNAGKRSNLYFFRDNSGNEVDLIYEMGDETVPIEIKSAQTVNNSFFKGLDFFRKTAGSRNCVLMNSA